MSLVVSPRPALLGCSLCDEAVVLEEKSLATTSSSSASSSSSSSSCGGRVPPPSSPCPTRLRHSARIKTNGSLLTTDHSPPPAGLVRFASTPLVHRYTAPAPLSPCPPPPAPAPEPGLRDRLTALGHRLPESRGRVYVGGATCCGFLWKHRRGRCPPAVRWRRRWFSLDAAQDLLHYRRQRPRAFGSPAAPDATGRRRASRRTVPLRAIVGVEAAAVAPALPGLAVLCLETTQRLFFLGAPPAAAAVWLDVIRLSCGLEQRCRP